nr:hypothetical protein [Proteiniborus sp. DW1]
MEEVFEEKEREDFFRLIKVKDKKQVTVFCGLFFYTYIL